MPSATLIPVNLAALRLSISREKAVRLIQKGDLSGELRAGRWFATEEGVDEFRARQDRSDDAAA